MPVVWCVRSFLLSIIIFSLYQTSAIAAVSTEHVSYRKSIRAYRFGQTAQVVTLGSVKVRIRPYMSGTLVAFDTAVVYHEPGTRQSMPWLQTDIIGTGNCGRKYHKYVLDNWRSSRFIVQFQVRCKNYKNLQIPYLHTVLYCKQCKYEKQYKKAFHQGKMFHIIPKGYYKRHKDVLFKKTYTPNRFVHNLHKGYKAYSTISTFIDGIKVIAGNITFQTFIIKLLIGIVVDAVVDTSFRYVKRATKRVTYKKIIILKAQFITEGWIIVCRVCGHKFEVKKLHQNQVLQCRKKICKARATVHFH